MGAVIAVAATVAPAHASNVTVTLSVGAVKYGSTISDCALSVPAGADGVVVLDAAVAKGCISSYHVQHYTFGNFVDCIDGVCGDPSPVFATYWGEYWDGSAASLGVDSFRAGTQHDLGFSYVTWVNCLEPNPTCDQF
ncbi:MAG: hypothetical protein ABR552_07805 [Actinomycetota bacterium]